MAKVSGNDRKAVIFSPFYAKRIGCPVKGGYDIFCVKNVLAGYDSNLLEKAKIGG